MVARSNEGIFITAIYLGRNLDRRSEEVTWVALALEDVRPVRGLDDIAN